MAAPVGGAAQRIRRHSERSGAAAWLEPCDVPAEPVRGGRRWPRLWAAPRSESGDTVSEVASPPAEIPWRRLSVRMLAVHPVREVLRSWPVLLGVLFLGARSGAEGGLWGLIGVGYVVVLGLVRWFTTTYRVSTEQVQVRRGLLRRETLTVPRDRVRTVDITASPLHRVLGLAQVSVGTGRTDRRDNGLKLDALSVDEAARLRVELLARSPVAAQPVEDADVAGAVGPPQVPPPETVLTAWHSTWLRYAPFSLSGIVTVAVTIGFLFRLANEANIRLSRVGPLVRVADRLAQTPLWLAATVVVLVFVVVVALFSTVAYVVAYWGFRLSRQPGGTLHIVRGLLTRRSITLEERRLRGVEISEPLLVRLAGGARGLAIATGLRVGRGAERGGSLLVPPAARADRAHAGGPAGQPGAPTQHAGPGGDHRVEPPPVAVPAPGRSGHPGGDDRGRAAAVRGGGRAAAGRGTPRRRGGTGPADPVPGDRGAGRLGEVAVHDRGGDLA